MTAHYALWKHLHDEHGLTLLESELDEIVRLARQPDALHASAPPDHKCADCQMDGEPCPTCYTAWWQKRHPHTEQV